MFLRLAETVTLITFLESIMFMLVLDVGTTSHYASALILTRPMRSPSPAGEPVSPGSLMGDRKGDSKDF